MKHFMRPFAVVIVSLAPSVVYAQAQVICAPPPLTFSVMAQGGPSDVVNTEARRFISFGGSWAVNVEFNTRGAASGEIMYVGAAYGIHAPGLAPGAMLLQSGIQGNVRTNFMNTVVFPFFTFGTGWSYWQVIADYNHSPFIRNADSTLQFPLAFGVAFLLDHLSMDLRATFNQAFGFDLISLPGGSPGLSQWTLNYGIGGDF